MPHEKRRVLVTGGAGFIGSHLANLLLQRGFCVGVLDNMSTGTHANLAACRQVGLNPRDLIAYDIIDSSVIGVIANWRPDVIVHLAAQARVTQSVANIAHDAASNVMGTIHILEAARVAQVGRIVLASSGGTIYGELSADQDGFVETCGRLPISPYGISKNAADSYIRLYSRMYGLPTVTLALGNVYGTRPDGLACPDVIPQFATTMIAGGAPIVRGDGNQTRDFVHIQDVVEAFRLAVVTPLPSLTTALNIGSGAETSVNEVVDLLARHLPEAPARRYTDPLAYEVTRNCLRSDAAAAVLDWRPAIDLPTGVSRVVAELTSQPSDLTNIRHELERIAV